MWERLSIRFAEGANGMVYVFQNYSGIGVKSVFGKTEYPILQAIGVEIIYHSIK